MKNSHSYTVRMGICISAVSANTRLQVYSSALTKLWSSQSQGEMELLTILQTSLLGEITYTCSPILQQQSGLSLHESIPSLHKVQTLVVSHKQKTFFMFIVAEPLIYRFSGSQASHGRDERALLKLMDIC